MSGHNETPNKSTLTSKKRDASSPLQESSVELKKSKLLKSPLTHSEDRQASITMAAMGGEPVLTEQDLDNIVEKMQKVFIPLVSKMIDSSLNDLKRNIKKHWTTIRNLSVTCQRKTMT